MLFVAVCCGRNNTQLYFYNQPVDKAYKWTLCQYQLKRNPEASFLEPTRVVIGSAFSNGVLVLLSDIVTRCYIRKRLLTGVQCKVFIPFWKISLYSTLGLQYFIRDIWKDYENLHRFLQSSSSQR